MRARNIKPGFFKNFDLADAGPHAQLLFVGLWLLADKEGRLKDQPRFIKAELFPYYDVDVNGELTVLSRLGHIRRFEVGEIGVIEVLNFKKHQSPHHTEKASDLPAYPGPNACNHRLHENHGELTVNLPLSNGEYPSDSLIPDSLIQGKSPTPKKPKVEHEKPKSSKVKTLLPADFALTPDLVSYVAKTIPDADPIAMFERFNDQSKANGWKYLDWTRAFQNYCRNASPGSGHFAAGQYPRKQTGAQQKWGRVS